MFMGAFGPMIAVGGLQKRVGALRRSGGSELVRGREGGHYLGFFILASA